ncbi:hypothetical protein AABM17_76 [Neisseria musculi]|uniref:Uncharacterized protein n=1 Tax=Neisseria musculi TaxID=1815583 RepID=A0A7H1MA39_9NEIS|nr:hypothetical protein H7A79_0077 [Neisseria musculi]
MQGGHTRGYGHPYRVWFVDFAETQPKRFAAAGLPCRRFSRTGLDCRTGFRHPLSLVMVCFVKRAGRGRRHCLGFAPVSGRFALPGCRCLFMPAPFGGPVPAAPAHCPRQTLRINKTHTAAAAVWGEREAGRSCFGRQLFTGRTKAGVPPVSYLAGFFTAGCAFPAALPSTVASSLNLDRIPSPIPFTFFKSSTLLKLPF